MINPPDLARITRWKRVITVTGPQDWVDSTRSSSLAQGVHLVGTKNGIPCTIEVEAEDAETLRFLGSPTPNKVMRDMRCNDPERYEEVHGKGTAIEHADYDERSTTTVDPSPSGLYL